MKKTQKKPGRFVRAAFIVAAPASLFIWSCSGQSAGSCNAPSLDWKMPAEVFDTTQENYAKLGWQSFIALNWPADLSYRGKPDTSKSIGDAGVRVWETFRLKEEMILPDAQRPDSWNGSGGNGLAARDLTKKSLFRLAKKFDSIPDDPDGGGEFNQAGSGNPLIDQDSNYVMFEIGVNESEYTYVRDHNYYDANVQIQQVHEHSFVNPPKGDTLVQRSGDSLVYQVAPSVASLPAFAQYGATEFKASWRILPAKDKDTKWKRYYHRTATIALPDGSFETQEVGLVGLHILRLTALTGSTWYWATFEQVDNLTPPANGSGEASFHKQGDTSGTANGYSYSPTPIKTTLPANPVPVNVVRITPIPAYIDSLNKSYQQLLAGTVWENYQLVGVVNPALGGNKSFPMNNATGIYTNVNFMANVTMETYKQKESFTKSVNFSNCVGCHSLGTPIFQTGNAKDSLYAFANYQIFTFLLSDANAPAQQPQQLTAKEKDLLLNDEKRKKPK
jgi:hypothetical protein